MESKENMAFLSWKGGEKYSHHRSGSATTQALPDALRPKAGHMNPQQQRVYEDFARIPRLPGAAAAAAAGPSAASGPTSPHKAINSDKVPEPPLHSASCAPWQTCCA